MGVDFSVNLAVGFYVSEDMIRAALGKTVDPKWHMEDRFDPKTGAKLTPEKVVDREGGIVLEIDDEEFEDLCEVAEFISDKIGCSYNLVGDGMGGDCDLVFGPKLDTGRGGVDFGHVSVGGGVDYSVMLSLADELFRIGQELKKLGIKIEEAQVLPACFVS